MTAAPCDATNATATDQINDLNRRIMDMEARNVDAHRQAAERMTAMEASTASQFSAVKAQVSELAASSGQVATKVQAMEELINSMAVGQQALQSVRRTAAAGALLF